MAVLVLNFGKNVNFGHLNDHKSILIKNASLVPTIVKIHHNVKLKSARKVKSRWGQKYFWWFLEFSFFSFSKSCCKENMKCNEFLINGGSSQTSKQYLNHIKFHLDQKMQKLLRKVWKRWKYHFLGPRKGNACNYKNIKSTAKCYTSICSPCIVESV